MKAVIIYDSDYGNTEQIARAMGQVLGNQEDICVVRVGEVRPEQFQGIDLLITGSPTQRFRPTPAISSLLERMTNNRLKGIRVAAFDTRLTVDEINKTPILAFFVRLFGSGAYAARHIAKMLQKNGGELVAPPEGFYVEGTEGPLVQGELERAVAWAKKILVEIQ
ncbi:MAG: flavodoxin family protein [Chloroflexi bacterium]|nr:MAG: flavodoxin family protein [Chloroflexota bacterium]